MQCFLKGISIRNRIKMKKEHQASLKLEMNCGLTYSWIVFRGTMGEVDDRRMVMQHVFNQYDRNGKGELSPIEVQMLHGDLRMGGISYPQVGKLEIKQLLLPYLITGYHKLFTFINHIQYIVILSLIIRGCLRGNRNSHQFCCSRSSRSRRDLMMNEKTNIHTCTLVSLLAKVTKVVFVCLFCLS